MVTRVQCRYPDTHAAALGRSPSRRRAWPATPPARTSWRTTSNRDVNARSSAPRPAGGAQLPDAVRPAGAHPLAGGQRLLPVVLLELRAARQLPGLRPRLPVVRPVGEGPVPGGARPARRAGGLRLRVRRPPRRHHHQPHLLRDGEAGQPAARVAGARHPVRGRVGRDGDDRQRRGPRLRRLRPARRLQVGPDRQRAGHRHLRGAVVHGRPAAGVGHRHRRGVHRHVPAGLAGPVGRHGGGDRAAAGPVRGRARRRRRHVVAVLQDHRHRRTRPAASAPRSTRAPTGSRSPSATRASTR